VYTSLVMAVFMPRLKANFKGSANFKGVGSRFCAFSKTTPRPLKVSRPYFQYCQNLPFCFSINRFMRLEPEYAHRPDLQLGNRTDQEKPLSFCIKSACCSRPLLFLYPNERRPNRRDASDGGR